MDNCTHDCEKLVLLEKLVGENLTLKWKVRKMSVSKGLKIYMGMNQTADTCYRYNVGMWSSNDRSELLYIENGNEKTVLSEHLGYAIETDRWYKVKIIVSPSKKEFFIDNNLLLTYDSIAELLQFIS